MRITVLILGFGLGAVMFVQTFLVYGLSSIGDDTQSSRAATAGLGMVVLWLFAVAFVFGIPKVSVLLFAIAGLVGIRNADNFPDLEIWGMASFILAGLSAVSIWQLQKGSRPGLDRQMVGQVGEVNCADCGAMNAAGARFCSSCARSLAARLCPTCSNSVSSNGAFCSRCGESLARMSYTLPPPQSASVEKPKASRGRRIPVLLSLCILAVAQVGAWLESGGTFGYGNVFGAAILIAGLGWFVYWVKMYGRGGLDLPEAVRSVLGPHEPPPAPASGAVVNEQPRFPSGLVAGIMILTALGSMVLGRVDDRHRSIRVIGEGMEPTLADGSFWTVAQHAFTTTEPARRDLIVYVDSGANGQSVKRVVGLPGERVTVEGGEVKINGEPIAEPYAEGATRCYSGDTCDIVLEDNEVFVLGDNRSNSSDSRAKGPVDLSQIRGRLTKMFWPITFPGERQPST